MNAVVFKRKSQANLKAAHLLLAERHPDGASNRLYYSLFQAAVYAFEHKLSTTYSKFTRDDRWTHQCVAHNTRLLRNRRDDRELYEAAQGLREQADYQDVPVSEAEIRELMPDVEALIRDLCA